MILIQQIHLPAPGLDEMHAQAKAERMEFFDTFVDEWADGTTRFDGTGEMLAGHIDAGRLVAVGGLTLDPFLGDPHVGRLRKIYVRPEWRRRGVGEAIVNFLLQHAQANFTTVRLQADNPIAARLYERLGFEPIADPHATHSLKFT